MSIIKLNAVQIGSYTKDGVKRDAYAVNGNEKDLAFYREQKGTYSSDVKEGPHAGKPLFTAKRTSYIGPVAPLKFVEEYDVKFVIDSEQWELDTMVQVKKMKMMGMTPSDIFASQQTSLFPETSTEEVVEDTSEELDSI